MAVGRGGGGGAHPLARSVTISVHITCAGRSDVGVIRSGNEDNYLMVPDRGIFIVADGMGGHAAGGVASGMAVRYIARELGARSEEHTSELQSQSNTVCRLLPEKQR